MKNHGYSIGFLLALLLPAAGFSQHITLRPGLKLNAALQNTSPDSLISSVKRDSSLAPFKYFLPLSGREINKTPIELNPEMRYNMPIMKPAKTSKILIAHLDLDFPYKYNMPVLKVAE